MTKIDKQSAIGALLLMAGCAFLGYQKHHPNLAFTIGFPAAMFVLYACMGRASSADWLVRHDADTFIFRKPFIWQTMYGLMALVPAFTAATVWQSYVHDPSYGGWLWLAGPASLFAFALLIGAATPSRAIFTPSRQEYTWTRGIWPFVRTSRGSTSGGTVTLTRSHNGRCVVRFRPATESKWGILVAFAPRDEAVAQACELADALGVLIERKR